MARGQQHISRTVSEYDDDLERRKRTDLARAQARTVSRPIKKELRHSQIEGRYILPEEVKELARKEKARREEAAQKKRKGFFSLFKRNKDKQPEVPAPEPQEPAPEPVKKKSLSLEERKLKKEKILKLRGIIAEEGISQNDDSYDIDDLFEDYPEEEYVFDSIPEETEENVVTSSFSFAESVKRVEEKGAYAPLSEYFEEQQPADDASFEKKELSFSDLSGEARRSAALFAPVPQELPDGTIASALSAAVGFIYWDEDGQPVDRIITIRRMFVRNGDILLDSFCHDISAPRLIPFSRGIRLYQLQTMTPCDNPREFLLYNIAGLSADNRFGSTGFARALSVVRYELTALAFAAKADFNKSDEESVLMLSYVAQRCPTIDFDEREMLNYISMLVPDEQSFVEAIEIVAGQPKDIVFSFTHTFLQMMLSDGVLHENERELLAELLYLLQLKGIDLNRLGLD